MLRFRTWIALSLLLVLAQVSSARALLVAPPPGPQKFAGASVIAVGRVAAIADQDVELGDANNPQTWRIAIVQVSEAIKGAKKGDQIRVGFFVPAQPKVINGGGIRISSGGRGIQFQVGQEGLFALQQHPSGKFLHAPMYFNFVALQTPNFQKEVADAKGAVAALANPKEALSKGSAQERLQAAALIVTTYRSPVGPNPKQEPVDAETSKLILKALRDAEWNQPQRFGTTHPMNVMFQLGLTEKDGFRPNGATPEQTHEAARRWLDANMDSYRIQRFVTTTPKAEEK